MTAALTDDAPAPGPTPGPTAERPTERDRDPSAGHPATAATATGDGPDNRMFCYGCNRWREKTPGWVRGKCPQCKAKSQYVTEPYVVLYDNAGNLIKRPKAKKKKAGTAIPASNTTKGALK